MIRGEEVAGQQLTNGSAALKMSVFSFCTRNFRIAPAAAGARRSRQPRRVGGRPRERCVVHIRTTKTVSKAGGSVVRVVRKKYDGRRDISTTALLCDVSRLTKFDPSNESVILCSRPRSETSSKKNDRVPRVKQDATTAPCTMLRRTGTSMCARRSWRWRTWLMCRCL